MNSLSSPDAQRGYSHAIGEFIEWYCSEPRLSFNRTVVLRYRIHLESRKLAPATMNLRPGAVRRLGYEAAGCGLLSPDLAARIWRVKGGAEPHVSVRAMILSLTRFGIAAPEQIYALEKLWAAHRKQNELNLYGKRIASGSIEVARCDRPQAGG